MNAKGSAQKTSVDVAIDDVTGRAKNAPKKLANATREVVTAVGDQVESRGSAAVRKFERAARRPGDFAHDARKGH